MDTALLLQLIAFPILLFLSAFFSGSETAYFSLNSLERDQLLKGSTGKTKTFINILFNRPDDILVTVLIGNMIVNVFATAISESFGDILFEEAAEIISISVMTGILLIVGEMTPKNIAIRHSLKYSLFSSMFLRYIRVFFKPLVVFLNWVKNVLIGGYSRKTHIAKPVIGGAVLSAIKIGYQNGKIQKNELNLLESFINLHQKTACEVMTPRIELRGFDTSTLLSEVFSSEFILQGRKNDAYRIVYDDDIDHVVGYIKRTDLLAAKSGGAELHRVSEIMRSIYAVPDGKIITELLSEMNDEDTEVAVVIGEYGGTAGVITYQTIVEELFEDFFPHIQDSIRYIGAGYYRVSGTTEIEEINEFFDCSFISERRTVAGLLMDVVEDIPEKGKTVRIDDFSFTIDSVKRNRITDIRVKKAEE